MKLTGSMEIESSEPQIIAFTGGGGKSTIIYTLALELAGMGKSLLVTTTTMIFHPDIKSRSYNTFFTGTTVDFLKHIPPSKGTITVAGKEIIADGKKLKGYEPDKPGLIKRSGYFDIILVEADGAKGKPIKAPAEYEPVVPMDTDIVVGVVGMDCIGSAINEENVHRSKIFTRITNSSMGDIIDTQLVIKLLNSSVGIFKDTSPTSRKIVILNKCDTQNRITRAKIIAKNIPESLNIERILITSMTGNDPVMAVIRS